tara:strand:+ start:1085 stop:1510 length:426 start_codon:yes stop_codon:yes gene_type:complete
MGYLIVPDNVDLYDKEEVVRFIKIAGLVFSCDVLDLSHREVDTIDDHFGYFNTVADVYLGKNEMMGDEYTSEKGYRVAIHYITYDGRYEKYCASHIVRFDFLEHVSPSFFKKRKPNIVGHRRAYYGDNGDESKSYKIEMYD